MSDFNDLLNDIQSQINAQAFTLNSVAVNAFVRKLPLKQESLDPANMIIVCPGKAESSEKFAFGSHYTVDMRVMVVIVAANDGLEYTNLPTYLQWRETIAGLIQAFTAKPNCLKADVEYDTPIDVEALSENYDYLSMTGKFVMFY